MIADVACMKTRARAADIRRVGRVMAVLVMTAPTAAGGKPDSSLGPIIEARASCITHEGGDLPAPGAAPVTPVPPKTGCSAKERDGTVCDALDGGEALRCLAREITIWDGVLDHLPTVTAGSAKTAPVKSATAAFRTFRDRACATYRRVSVNPVGEEIVQSCRLAETVRFSQKLYDAVFSP